MASDTIKHSKEGWDAFEVIHNWLHRYPGSRLEIDSLGADGYMVRLLSYCQFRAESEFLPTALEEIASQIHKYRGEEP